MRNDENVAVAVAVAVVRTYVDEGSAEYKCRSSRPL